MDTASQYELMHKRFNLLIQLAIQMMPQRQPTSYPEQLP
jgi:hypothetical protein